MGLIRKTASIATLGLIKWRSKAERLGTEGAAGEDAAPPEERSDEAEKLGRRARRAQKRADKAQKRADKAERAEQDAAKKEKRRRRSRRRKRQAERAADSESGSD